MVDETKSRLGRGLAALIGDAGDEEGVVERGRGQKKVPIEFLRPNARNPRRTFDEAELAELAESIKAKGIIQPVLVRVVAGMADAYEIIAGERRWRAAQRAGLHEVPVVVVEATDREALELALIENVQRSDLNAIEEAAGYEKLIAEFSYSQADLGRVMGKSRSHIANTIRLLNLPENVRALVLDGQLSAGHARALLAVANPMEVAQRAIDKGLTVRDLERIGQDEARRNEEAPASADAAPIRARNERPGDADTRALEAALEEAIGLVVNIRTRGEAGELRIRYRSLEQLDSLCHRLKG